MQYVNRQMLNLRVYDRIMNKLPNQQPRLQLPQQPVTPDTQCYRQWRTAVGYLGNPSNITCAFPVEEMRGPYSCNMRTCSCSGGLPMKLAFPQYNTRTPMSNY